MINVRYKLRLCIIGNSLLLLVIILVVSLLNNGKSMYFRSGWHDDLILVSVPINTLYRYIMTIIFYFIFFKININCMKVLNFHFYITGEINNL